MKRIIVVFAILTVNLTLFGQDVNFEEFVPISGEQNPYDKKAVEERPVVEHVTMQEVDVKYQKKIHRVIDTRQKMNKVLTWPKNPLNAWLHLYAIDGKVKAYNNDSLYSWMHPEDAKKVGSREYTLAVPNPFGDPDDPFDTVDTLIVEEFEAYKIVKYILLEDWFFDHKHSVFRPRIMAIAPLYMMEFGGVDIGEVPMFWLKMDELRPLLKNLELFNTQNDAGRLSYDHFFEYRMFDSYIIKESNMYDAYIKEMEEYKDDNMAALLKSEEIKNDLFIWEHDLWEY